MDLTREQSKLAQVDVLRAFAIIGVVVVHTSQRFDLPFKAIFDYGQMGVQLFFVVSAYTLFRSYEHRQTERAATRKFFIRRFLRIAPLYYCGLLAYAIMRLKTRAFGVVDYSSTNVLANLAFVHNLIPEAINDVVPGGWSIGCEMLFYLAVPWLFATLGKTRASKLAWFVGLLLLGNLLAQVAATTLDPTGQLLSSDFRYYSIISQAPVFALGIMLFRLSDQRKDGIFLPLLTFASFTAVSMATTELRILGELGRYVAPTLSGISFVGLSLAVLRLQAKWPKVLLAVGQHSYSIYLVHFFFAWGVTGFLKARVGEMLPDFITFAICVMMSLAGSLLVAKGITSKIEAAGISLAKRLTAESSVTKSTIAA